MDTCEETPEMAAESLVVVKKYNYLAHVIQEIESMLFSTMGKCYYIIARVGEALKKNSKTVFYTRGCVIYLPFDCEDTDDRVIRLLLAHELGHLMYNKDKLMSFNFTESNNASTEEELYAWRFAYHLIKRKGEEHRKDIERRRYIYTDEDLKRSLFSTVNKIMPEIYADIKRILR
jgi:Zn-dependent peptidase ImmA (M78 family)